MTKNQWIADGLLLAAAIIWGSAFAVVKNTLDSVPPSMMIALRFGIAALISGVILRKHLRGLTRGQVLMGLLVGVLTGLAYIVQTIGLQDTTAGKNAFLTTIYVLLVPFGSAVLFHEKLGARRYVAAVLMLLGIGILSLDGESGGLNRGDVLTLVCGVLYAAQIISVGRCNERMDTYALIVLEFAFAALTGLCWSLATERGMPTQWNMQSIGGILYVAYFRSMGPVYDPDSLGRQIIGGLGNHRAGAGVFPVGAFSQVDHLSAFLHQPVQLLLEALVDSGLAAVTAGKGGEGHLLALIGGKRAGAVVQCAETGGAGAPAVGFEAAQHGELRHNLTPSSSTMPCST